MKKILLGLLCSAALHAGVVTSSCGTVGFTATDFTNAPLNCAQYNGAEPLLSVQLVVTGRIQGNIELLNNGTNAESGTASISTDVRLFEGATLVLSVPLSYGFNFVNLGSGENTNSGPQSDVDTNQGAGSSPLASYIGAGTFEVLVNTLSGQSIVGGGGNIASVFTNEAQAEVSVEYTFADEVPEPGTMGLLGGGFLGLALVARRKKTA